MHAGAVIHAPCLTCLATHHDIQATSLGSVVRTEATKAAPLSLKKAELCCRRSPVHKSDGKREVLIPKGIPVMRDMNEQQQVVNNSTARNSYRPAS